MKPFAKISLISIFFVLFLIQGAFAFDVTVTSNAITSRTESTFVVQYEDSYFNGKSTQYNHKLAQASLGLALSAFRPVYADEVIDAQEYAQKFLTACGFTNIHQDDYDKDPSLYTVASLIGSKKVKDKSGDYTLIAVGICGGGYANEWLSNFTVGNGTEHEGFASAAHLVFNRIFGYIGRANIQGRIKIWISGFSRAAAVGNITAARLVDCGVFKQEDIFAYLFATPRTTKDPKPGMYGNIFSIVGQYDIVPQVPLQGWGFERYGTVFNTPLKETNSDYYQRTRKVNEVYKAYTGQEYWANEAVNFQLHTFLGYIDSIVKDQESYVKYVQDSLISMFKNRSPNNILRTFSNLSEDGNLVNEDNEEDASMLMNFIFRLVLDSLTKSGDISATWNYDSSFAANLLHEHTQDVYLGWMLSSDDPAQVLTDYTEYSRIILLPGSDSYELTVTDETGSTVAQLKNDEITVGLYKDCPIGIKIVQEKKYGTQITLTIPHDIQYFVWYECSEVGDGLVLARIDFDTTAVAENEIRLMNFFEEGKALVYSNSGEVSSNVEAEVLTAVDFGDSSDFLPAGLVSQVLMDESQDVDWRNAIIMGVLAPVLIFSIALIIVVLVIKLAMKHRFSMIPLLVFSLMLVGLILEELFFLLYKNPIPRGISKAVMGLLSIGLAMWGLNRHRKADELKGKNRELFVSIAVCIGLCAIGDLLLNMANHTPGLIVLMVVHLILTVAYMRYRRLSVYHWISWIALLFAFAMIIFLFGRSTGNFIYVAMVYALIISLMVVSSTQMPPLVILGSILLMLYDIINGAYKAFSNIVFFHFAFMLIYYLAVFCLAYSCSRPFEDAEEKV